MRLLALFRILYFSQLLFTNNLFKSNWSTHTAARSYAHTRTHTLKTPSDAPEKTTKRTTTKRAAKQQKSNVSKFSFALQRENKSNRNLKDCQCDFDLMFIVFFSISKRARRCFSDFTIPNWRSMCVRLLSKKLWQKIVYMPQCGQLLSGR